MATAYEKRTDIHRRGVFQPKFYRFVGWYYLGFVWRNGRLVASRSVDRCSAMLETFRRSEEAWDFKAIVYGDFGQCAVCGVRFAMGEVWQHDETKDMIHIGHDCAEKYEMLSGTDWTALDDERRRKGLAIKTAAENEEARARIAAEHPAFIEALWLADANHFIRNVGWRYLNAARELTQPQIDGVISAAVRVREELERKAREARERAARLATLAHVGTVGKRETWRGVKLVFVTSYETVYGVVVVHKFEGPGFVLCWKASGGERLTREDVGKVYNVTGTVKEHADYKGEKQTTIQRCKVQVSE